MKNISVVLCSILFASAFATGCKKEEKGGEGAAAATCEGVGAKVAAQLSKEASGKSDKMPPEMKTKMEEGMKKIPAAIIQACKDDKWSQEALDCAAKAADPKKDCEGKLTPAQEDNMKTAAMAAMGLGDMMGKQGAAVDPSADLGSGSGSAMGSGSGTGSAETPPADDKAVPPGTYPATCEGVATRAMAEVADDLPPGAPADFLAKFGTMLTTRCTEDKWSQEILDCGVTAANPKVDCRPKMTPEQSQKLDEAQDALGKEMMEAMVKANGGGDGAGAGGSSGIKECDDLMAAIQKLAECPKIDDQTRKMYQDMAQGFGMINMLPEDQKATMVEQCKQGLQGVEQGAKAYGC